MEENGIHIAAIDWSGAKASGGRRDIAVAEYVDGQLQPPRTGLSREQVVQWLLARAAASAEMVVGLDFAFSLPAWFARDILRVADVFGVWDAVSRDGERWLEGSAPWPFWGRGQQVSSTNLPPEKAFRQTELDMEGLTATRPKSVFQLVGSGQVGPGSLRGIPMLRELRADGFAVWPFDDFGLPLVVEIYPRVLTGDVIKSSLDARSEFLERFSQWDESLAKAVASTEHAFDAACSAIVMSRHLDELRGLRREDPPYSVEGKIWTPAAAAAFLASEAEEQQPVTASFAGTSPEGIEDLEHGKPELAPASSEMRHNRRPMVRVMRKHVSGFDDVSSDELLERITKLEALLADPEHAALRTTAESQLRACRRALKPDFGHTKVHHATDCWYVDRYEEGRFPGGAKRKFVLVPAETVPDNVSGCQFCESGRPAAVKLKRAGSEASSPAAAPTQPVPGSIQIGCMLHVIEDATGKTHRWHIVPPNEGDPSSGKISSASPIGKALVGRFPGDLIEITVPSGIRRLKIIDVASSGQSV